jgi:long-chain acyl-CoA synthetase
MNIATFLENSAQKTPDKTAVRHNGEEITFGQLNRACNRLAGGLANLGLLPGDRCMLMMPNSIPAISVYYALARLGAEIIPVNFLYRKHELEHILKDAAPKCFIGAKPYLEQISIVMKEAGSGPALCLALGAEGDNAPFISLENVSIGQETHPSFPAGDEATLNILYTSGTTGVPKGVMLTHGNLTRTARIIGAMRGHIDPKTVIIGVLPLYHVFGITSVLHVSMHLGLTIELFSGFEPEKVIGIIEKEDQTLLFAVPTMINRLIQLAADNPPRRASLRFCVSGGASLPVDLLKRFEGLFQTTIHEGYGLTECPVCIENPYGQPTKPGSIGLPIPEFQARIVDDQGNEVLPGQAGELLIQGPGVMKGYLNRPQETAETLKDGWLYTGDMARRDEDQYIRIVDRKKELIIRGGYNVYPREIEELLYQIPDIWETAVYGVPHEDLGEEIAAVVFLKEGSSLGAEEIKSYVKDRVAPYKYPRIIRLVDDPLPKSGSGKILKKEVRRIYSGGISE